MLKLTDISKRFGEHILFEKLTCSFGNNGLVLVLGPSGSGKTTLLRIIAGLESADSGNMEKTDSMTPFAFQNHRLFPSANAIDNIALIRPKDVSLREKATEALAAFGFSNEDMSKPASMLSGGMKQRVSLLRAMLAGGEILLLDEPTKELDSRLADQAVSAICEESKRRLVIVTTHSPELFSSIEHEEIHL